MKRDNDPLDNFRFKLELGYIVVAGFSECTGLQMETKVYEYKEGGRNNCTLKFPEAGSVGNITLKRGITTGAHSDALYEWHHDVMTGTFDENKNPNKRPSDPDKDISKQCAIVLQDKLGNEIKRWHLFRPLPVKWVGPDLRATANELAIETLVLVCEGIQLS